MDVSESRIRRRAPGSMTLTAGLHPVLRRVYAARGIESESDLDLSLERLAPVGSLEGVDAAAALLAEHRAGRVLVVGDFDADGATSTALVVRALRALRFAHVDFLVPNRFRFGYGLTPEIVALAATRRPSLIMTVDNGISSIAGAAAARELNIQVLVTDHHLPGAVLPDADVIVNPNLAASRFASPALAGVGVAFYVIAALARFLGEADFRVVDLAYLASAPGELSTMLKTVLAVPQGTDALADARRAFAEQFLHVEPRPAAERIVDYLRELVFPIPRETSRQMKS